MPLFKRKLTIEQVCNELLKSLNFPVESVPDAPVETQVTREQIHDEVIYLQGFLIHLVTSAKLFGTPAADAILDAFWGTIFSSGMFDNFNTRIEDYKWSYENLFHPNGKEYCIGNAFASNCGAEDGEPLDFFTTVGAGIYSDGTKRLNKFYDSIKVSSV